jgi:hypothetical protein
MSDKHERLKREKESDTATPPHGEPLIEKRMEQIAESNLPKADDEESVPDEPADSADEQARRR